MIEDAVKVCDETKVQRLIEGTVNKMVHYLFKDAHEKTLNGS